MIYLSGMMDLEPVNLSAVSIDDSSIPTTSTPKKDRRKSYDVYLCTECAQSFSRKANLNAHMRYKHKKMEDWISHAQNAMKNLGDKPT